MIPYSLIIVKVERIGLAITFRLWERLGLLGDAVGGDLGKEIKEGDLKEQDNFK